MRKWIRNALLLGCLGAAASCGVAYVAGYCANIGGFNVPSKTGNCAFSSGQTTIYVPPATVCNGAIAYCTASDQAALNAVVNCYHNLPVCQAGSESSWLSQVQACKNVAGTISAACINAFNAYYPNYYLYY